MARKQPFWRRPINISNSSLRTYFLCTFAIGGMIWGFRWFSIPALFLGLLIAIYLRKSRPTDAS